MPLDMHSASAAKDASLSARRYTRAPLSVPITLHHLMTGNGIGTTRGVSLDISEGGMAALVQGNLRLGEMVEIDLAMPKCSLSAVAIVRHTSSGRYGFEFLGLTEQERRQIVETAGRC
jgi:c-di-GMP-binding flagellar brake protein YcgR